MKKVMVGIIGCGTIANSAHIPAYLKNEDVEIKYFCDIIPERAKAAVEKYGCGIAVEDYHRVLEDPEVEAISVCTPNRMHTIIAIDAMRAGKHATLGRAGFFKVRLSPITTFVPILQLSYIHFASVTARRIHPADACRPNLLYSFVDTLLLFAL